MQGAWAPAAIIFDFVRPGYSGFSTYSWWRHQIETFSALLALCARNSPVTGEFPAQRPVTRSFDVFFDLRLNLRLSKRSGGWWFNTPSPPLWRHCNIIFVVDVFNRKTKQSNWLQLTTHNITFPHTIQLCVMWSYSRVCYNRSSIIIPKTKQSN